MTKGFSIWNIKKRHWQLMRGLWEEAGCLSKIKTETRVDNKDKSIAIKELEMWGLVSTRPAIVNNRKVKWCELTSKGQKTVLLGEKVEHLDESGDIADALDAFRLVYRRDPGIEELRVLLPWLNADDAATRAVLNDLGWSEPSDNVRDARKRDSQRVLELAAWASGGQSDDPKISMRHRTSDLKAALEILKRSEENHWIMKHIPTIQVVKNPTIGHRGPITWSARTMWSDEAIVATGAGSLTPSLFIENWKEGMEFDNRLGWEDLSIVKASEKAFTL